jgi:hypothetical protein
LRLTVIREQGWRSEPDCGGHAHFGIVDIAEAFNLGHCVVLEPGIDGGVGNAGVEHFGRSIIKR